jgi:hypothetical protein
MSLDFGKLQCKSRTYQRQFDPVLGAGGQTKIRPKHSSGEIAAE